MKRWLLVSTKYIMTSIMASKLMVYWGEPKRAPHWLKSVMVLYVACTDCENDKMQLTSHLIFVMVLYVACTDCENNKIRLTSHPSFVMVSYVACTDCENDKIQFTSHSSFVMVLYVACTDCENDKIWWTSYSTFHTLRVQTVSVEGSMKWRKRDLDDEENVTNVKKRN